VIIKDYLETDEVTKILLFTASWCGPCKVLKKTLQEMAESYRNDINIYQINIEENEALTKIFEVKSIPTLLFIKNNEIEERLTGTAREDLLIEKISKLI